jgi:hypothetical protein
VKRGWSRGGKRSRPILGTQERGLSRGQNVLVRTPEHKDLKHADGEDGGGDDIYME